MPALLLLHGGGGSLEDWMQAQEELQRLAVRHGTAIVVPDGDAWSWYADGIEAGTGIETHLVHELLPEAGRRLPLDGRWGVAGYSMGGHGALALALRNPGVFRSASSMSGVVDLLADPTRNGQERVFGRLPESLDRWKSHSARHLLDLRPDAFRGLELLVSCGTGDRFIGVNRRFHEALQAAGIPHAYDEGPGRHDWDYWVGRLPSHVAWHAERLRTAPSPEGLPRE